MNRHLIGAISAAALAVGGAASAATQAETYAAREAGLNWLVTHQQADGSWLGQGGTSPAGDGVFNNIDTTAVALMSFTSEARGNAFVAPVAQGPLGHVDYKSDFVLTAVQQAAVTKGIAYLETQAQVMPISAGQGPFGSFNPDVNGNGVGVSWGNGSIQSTSLAFQALQQAQDAQFTSGYSANQFEPGSIIPIGALAGRTGASVAQDVADFLAYGQIDRGVARGGWDYTPNTGSANATQTTFALMSLNQLESRYGATVPGFLRPELGVYAASATNYGLGPDYGGVGEFSSGSPSFQATLLGTRLPLFLAGVSPGGGGTGDQQFAGAISYLNTHWNDLGAGAGALGDGNIGNPLSVWLFDKQFAGAADTTYLPGPPSIPYEFTDGRKGSVLYGTYPGDFVVSDFVNNIGGDCGEPADQLVSGACNWSEDYQQWLVTHQNADGSFSSGDGFPSDAATTALYLQAIDGYDSPAVGPAGGVPEPAAWTLMLAGFGLAGAALRRRRALVSA